MSEWQKASDRLRDASDKYRDAIDAEQQAFLELIKASDALDALEVISELKTAQGESK